MHKTLNITLAGLLLTAVLVAPSVLHASESEEALREQLQAEEEALRQRREELMADIERTRLEAERAAQQAREKAEKLRMETQRVREEQRLHADESRRHQEQHQRDSEMARAELRQHQEQHQRELERVRRELSRTHRELQRASQEVARAHRDLTFAEEARVRATLVNLGDRPMIGVILGEQDENGIEIIGLSPDGPAERAGLRRGDVLTALRGEKLSGAEQGAARNIIFEVLGDVADGEEIRVEVLRDGNTMDFMLKPEKREPASWASFIRLPEPPAVVADIPSAPGAPGAPTLPHAEAQIVIPSIDTAELAAQAEIMAEQFEEFRAIIHDGEGSWSMAFEDGAMFEEFEFEFDSETLDQLSERALGEASIWLGSPATFGVRFTELNEGLGQYFGTSQGVLVLEASSDNALKLQPGDVVLSIGQDQVNEASDVVRALRGYEAGQQIKIAIKRQQRDESLEVILPANRFGP